MCDCTKNLQIKEHKGFLLLLFVPEYIFGTHGAVITSLRITDIKFKNAVVICLWNFFLVYKKAKEDP